MHSDLDRDEAYDELPILRDLAARLSPPYRSVLEDVLHGEQEYFRSMGPDLKITTGS